MLQLRIPEISDKEKFSSFASASHSQDGVSARIVEPRAKAKPIRSSSLIGSLFIGRRLFDQSVTLAPSSVE